MEFGLDRAGVKPPAVGRVSASLLSARPDIDNHLVGALVRPHSASTWPPLGMEPIAMWAQADGGDPQAAVALMLTKDEGLLLDPVGPLDGAEASSSVSKGTRASVRTSLCVDPSSFKLTSLDDVELAKGKGSKLAKVPSKASSSSGRSAGSTESSRADETKTLTTKGSVHLSEGVETATHGEVKMEAKPAEAVEVPATTPRRSPRVARRPEQEAASGLRAGARVSVYYTEPARWYDGEVQYVDYNSDGETCFQIKYDPPCEPGDEVHYHNAMDVDWEILASNESVENEASNGGAWRRKATAAATMPKPKVTPAAGNGGASSSAGVDDRQARRGGSSADADGGRPRRPSASAGKAPSACKPATGCMPELEEISSSDSEAEDEGLGLLLKAEADDAARRRLPKQGESERPRRSAKREARPEVRCPLVEALLYGLVTDEMIQVLTFANNRLCERLKRRSLASSADSDDASTENALRLELELTMRLAASQIDMGEDLLIEQLRSMPGRRFTDVLDRIYSIIDLLDKASERRTPEARKGKASFVSPTSVLNDLGVGGGSEVDAESAGSLNVFVRNESESSRRTGDEAVQNQAFHAAAHRVAANAAKRERLHALRAAVRGADRGDLFDAHSKAISSDADAATCLLAVEISEPRGAASTPYLSAVVAAVREIQAEVLIAIISKLREVMTYDAEVEPLAKAVLLGRWKHLDFKKVADANGLASWVGKETLAELPEMHTKVGLFDAVWNPLVSAYCKVHAWDRTAQDTLASIDSETRVAIRVGMPASEAIAALPVRVFALLEEEFRALQRGVSALPALADVWLKAQGKPFYKQFSMQVAARRVQPSSTSVGLTKVDVDKAVAAASKRLEADFEARLRRLSHPPPPPAKSGAGRYVSQEELAEFHANPDNKGKCFYFHLRGQCRSGGKGATCTKGTH